MKRHRLSATLVLALLALAPLAFAQTAKPKKKGAKPADSAAAASASASASAPDTSAASNPPAPAPSAEPSASASAKELPDTPPEAVVDATDTKEDPAKRYYFVGARYRGNLIPQFLENMFVDDGATFYSNSVGFELDMRTDGHSTIPWITYANYDTGDVLFLQKGKPDLPQNYSDVKSRLGAIYLGLDEMWSAPLDEGHHWDFEYGFGVGIGVLFGNLYNDWVYQNDAGGSLHGTNGHSYSQCPGPGNALPAGAPMQPAANPCDPAQHNPPTDTKTGGYQEKNWFGGGSVPVIFPHISFPQFSIRYKPVKSFEARLGLGFSLTGFWFGLSGDYGLEKTSAETEAPKKTGNQPKLSGTF
jgi:hypothetical protein